MKLTGTKKPCHPPRFNKVICANTGILTMNNITPINSSTQVRIDVSELQSLLNFVQEASKAFEEVHTLCTVIQEKVPEQSHLQILATLAMEKSNQWENGCLSFENTELFDKIKEEKLGVAA